MKKPSAILLILLLLLLLPAKTSLGQDDSQMKGPVAKSEYLRFVSGYMMVSYSNRTCDLQNQGIRIFSEYQREFSKNWFYGVGIDAMIPVIGRTHPLVKNLSATIYHRLPLVPDRWFLSHGVGLGGNIIFYENEPLRVRPTINVNLNMLWRIAPVIYLEFSPFLILPTRHNIPMPNVSRPVFSYAFLSVGVSIRL